MTFPHSSCKYSNVSIQGQGGVHFAEFQTTTDDGQETTINFHEFPQVNGFITQAQVVEIFCETLSV